MTTAQYFDELIFCLNQLPAAERDEAVRFYREYADEAGLTSYEQLTERFGTPKELAYRIRTGTAEMPASQSPSHAGRRGFKKLPLCIAGLLTVGLLLFAVGSAIGRSSAPRNGNLTLSAGGTVTGTDSPVTLAETSASDTSGAMELDTFSSMDISVVAADVRIVSGESFSLSYQLHESEALVRAEVDGDTLKFRTEATGPRISGGDWHVTVTVPADTQLDSLDITTVSGDIEDSGHTCDEASLCTTSGVIQLSGVTANQLDASTVSGSLGITGSVSELSVESVSGSIDLDGDFGEINAQSVSGGCALAGTLEREAEVETVSGRIQVSFPDVSVNASSLGSVYKDNSRQGRTFNQHGGSAELNLESISGEIEILSA